MALSTLPPVRGSEVFAAIPGEPQIDIKTPRPTPPWQGANSKMIAADLTPAQAEKLRCFLESYSDIFDLGLRYWGQLSILRRRINTGDAIALQKRPYRVSRI